MVFFWTHSSQFLFFSLFRAAFRMVLPMEQAPGAALRASSMKANGNGASATERANALGLMANRILATGIRTS